MVVQEEEMVMGKYFLVDQGSRISTIFYEQNDMEILRKTRLFMRAGDKSQAVADLVGMKNGLKNDPYTDLDGNAIPAAGDTSVYAMASH